MEKAKKVIWTDKAAQNAELIYHFIASDSFSRAENIVNKLYEFSETIAFFPLKYPLCYQR